MTTLVIQCPSCKAKWSIALVRLSEVWPYRCWKCHRLFRVRIEAGELKSCMPLGGEGLEREGEY